MQSLPENPQELKSLCSKLYLEIDWLKRDVSHLEGMLRLSAHARFGASSESTAHPGMQSLFPEGEAGTPEETPEEKKVVIKCHERTITRKPIPDDIPREDILIDVADKCCACCGSDDLKKVAEQVSEKLHYVPATAVVHRYIRPVYSCKKCETMKFAHLPSHPIPKCSVTTETIAQIAVSKYVDGLPLYRQEQIFLRHNIEIGRDKMARWLIQISEKLEPIANLLHQKIISSDLMQMDETTVQVLKEKGRVPTAKSFMMVQARGSPAGEAIVLFHYNPSRAGAVIEQLLSGFKGILMTDGLEVYGSVCAKNNNLVHVGCWSHARRKFVDAQKSLKPSRRKDAISSVCLNLIDELFKVERKTKDFLSEDRLSLRQEESAGVIGKLSNILQENLEIFPKKSPTGAALHYLSNQWEKLIKFLNDGRIPLHNNFTENMIRPFTVGRKNWLFSDQPEGAKASAIIYSLLVTAQVNGLNPYEYLCRTLKSVANVKPDYENLLPFGVQETLS